MIEGDNSMPEAIRQMSICNACRYCEGYCAVWDAIEFKPVLNKGYISHLANLCHDCRDCFYACPYKDPDHEFKLNIPRVLGQVRVETYYANIRPKFWGESVRNIKIRGSRYNTGIPLRSLIENGALMCGSEKAGHMVAVDTRSPEFDAGIVSRIDAIPWGIVINKNVERFYDEGEDIWPKRYAIWGRLVAEQDSQLAYAIIDNKSIGKFMPTAYPSIDAYSIDKLADNIGLKAQDLSYLISDFNGGIVKKDDDVFNWSNHKLAIPKSHWAVPINTPPYHAYPLSPGLTFTYQGIRINRTGRVVLKDGELENGFAAGEIASGNVLRSGYLAGFGLTIGTTLGRLAGGWEND